MLFIYSYRNVPEQNYLMNSLQLLQIFAISNFKEKRYASDIRHSYQMLAYPLVFCHAYTLEVIDIYTYQ